MAFQTISGGTTFAEGTSVGVYLRSQWGVEGVTGAPSGSAVATATVISGVLSFSGLADGTEYVAYAGSPDRYKHFSTPAVSAGSSGSAVPADPPRRQRVTNLFINPVAGVDTTAATASRPSDAPLTRVTGDGPLSDVTTSFRATGTPAGDAGIQWGQDAANRVSAAGNEREGGALGVSVYAGCMPRVPTAKTGTKLELAIVFMDAAGVVLRTDVVCTRDPSSAWGTRMEGFSFGPATTRLVAAQVTAVGSSGAAVDLRATLLTIVVDPANGVPVLPAGSRLGHAWAGTAHASASIAHALPAPLALRGFNDNTPTSSRGTSPTLTVTDAEDIALHQEIGATVVRFGVDSYSGTRGALPQSAEGGPIDWTPTYIGQYLDRLRKAGLKAIVIGGGPPGWLPPTGSGGTQPINVDPQYYDDIAALWAKLAAQYRDVLAAIEWINEPNLHVYWGGQANAATYVAQLTVGYQAIKAVAPELPVLASCGSPLVTTGPGTDIPYDTFLTGLYAAGVKAVCDGISFHAYPARPGTGADTTHPDFPDGFDLSLRKIAAIMDTNGDQAKGIWVTETGTQTDAAGDLLTGDFTERQHAQALSLLTGIASRHPRVSALCIHTIVNSTTTARWQVVQAPRLRRRRAFYTLQAEFGRAPTLAWGPWRKVGDPGEPAFNANWAHLGGTVEPLRFRENGEVVQVRGYIKRTGSPAANEVIFTFPAGTNGDADLRPTYNTQRGVGAQAAGTDVAGRFFINPSNGNVQWAAGDPTSVFIINTEYTLA